MKILGVSTIFFFIISFPIQGQWMDSLSNAFRGKKSFDFRFESRNSFLDNERTEVQSLKFGITFDRKLSLGLGYSWLSTPVVNPFYLYDEIIGRDTLINKTLRLNYVCPYIDFIFYKSKKWQYSIPMQFGIGNTYFTYAYRDIETKSKSRVILLYEPGVNVKYKIFSWLGIGANVGYRIVLKNNKYTGNKFNSPIYSAGVLIYWDKLALKLFPKNKKFVQWFGPEE